MDQEQITEQEQDLKITTEKDDGQKDSRYQEGDILTFVRVRFPGNSRSFPFLIGRKKISYGQKVMAMSDRGMAVGYVNSFPYEMKFKKEMLPLKTISKIASDDDLQKDVDNYRRQKEFEVVCQDLIEKHELKMNLTHVELTQFGKKVVFYFNAPARVDFRGLVRDLVSELKLRIELRQISVRDRAAAIGNIGPCGRELCCSSFLSKYGNTNIKMAKNQNLTINFSKLNGVCGQLKCCLKYEDEVYGAKRKKLPNEGQFISTHSGHKGKVEKLHLLSEHFDMLCDDGVIRRFVAEQNKEVLKGYRFPEKFDHISRELTAVIGLEDLQRKKEQNLKRDLEQAEYQGKKEGFKTYINALKTSDILSHFISAEEIEQKVADNKITRPKTNTTKIEKTELKTSETTEDKEHTPKKTNRHKKPHRHHKGKYRKKNFKKSGD